MVKGTVGIHFVRHDATLLKPVAWSSWKKFESDFPGDEFGILSGSGVPEGIWVRRVVRPVQQFFDFGSTFNALLLTSIGQIIHNDPMIKTKHLKKLIVTAIHGLGLSYPEVSEEKLAHLAEARAKLEGKSDDEG